MRKLKFYLIGLLPGLLIVFFILNKKGASCSGYLPNSRVIAETLSKEFTYSEEFKTQMQNLKINENFLKDSILQKGEINFDRSKAQQEPCPQYLLVSPEKNSKYEITFEKCKNEAKFLTLKKL
ncbi:hypothetical protein [Cloacibacterium sp.]|jgi:hypothetical protein|uniref:hypothetical protein n=1 Tax=Cloacibacterium sp. TaxID=1913682 RepID=UPI0039E5985F